MREDETGTAAPLYYSYRAGRTHPMVTRLPGLRRWVFTIPELLVAVAAYLLLAITRPVWGAIVTGPIGVLVLLGGPILLGRATRWLQLEGRDPLQMLAGLALLVSRPAGGIRGGRRARAPRPQHHRPRLLVQPGHDTGGQG